MSWRKVQLAEFLDDGGIDIRTGPFGTQLKAADYTHKGTPVINVRNVGYGDLRPEKLEFVPDQVVSRLPKHILKTRDIVFGRKGAVDRHLFVSESETGWMQGSDCIRLRVLTDAIHPAFLSFALRLPNHKQWMLTQCSNKATMASLNQDVIGRIPINLPDPATQAEIASILSAYDDLIENNRRRIQLLEQAARLLYREWFVHLRFPGHEHVTITDGVPEGWAEGVVADFYSTGSGGTPSRKNIDFYTGEIPWVKTQELTGGFILSTDERITDEAVKRSAAKLFPQHTVLIAMYGATIGQTAILSVPSTTNQACCAIIPKRNGTSYVHAYLFFCHHKTDLVGLGQGAAQNNVSQQVIKSFKMVLPRKKLLEAFSEQVFPLFDQIEILQKNNINLTKARDLLLPRLMNGEVAV